MKALATIFTVFFLTVLSITSNAQSFANYYSKSSDSFNPETAKSIELGVEATRSIRGWVNSWNVGMNLSNRFKVAYFNSVEVQSPESPKGSEKGLEVAYLIKAKGRLNAGVVFRNSVFDNKFVAVVPMLQTKVWVTNRLSIKSNMGISDRYPVFNSAIQFRLN